MLIINKLFIKNKNKILNTLPESMLNPNFSTNNFSSVYICLISLKCMISQSFSLNQ